MKILSGSSHPSLAQNIAKQLGVEEVVTDISEFANHEKRVHITQPLHGQNVVLVQSLSHPTNDHLVELLLLADALERCGVRHVSLILPWMGYSLQDKVFRPGEPIAAKVVANVISQAYIKRVFLLDLHNTSTPGFYSIPCQHLSAQPLFEKYVCEEFSLSDVVVASPDFGGLKRARGFADSLGVGLVNIDKHRDLQSGVVSVKQLHGDVDGKDVIILDDVILSGGTAVEAARVIKSQGARSVHFMATHGLFVSGALEKLSGPEIDSIIITNSINHTDLPIKIKVLDCSPLFAQALTVWQ